MPNIVTLDNNSPSIQHLCKVDKRLAKVIKMVGPITYSPYDSDAYSFLIHEIIEQMLSTKAANKIYGRLEEKCNYQITPDRINNLSTQDLKNIGTSSSKANYIRNVTTAIIQGNLDLKSLSALSDEEVISKLTEFHGIGMWTAKMYLIFVLDRQDILPYEDGAFIQTYRWLYKTSNSSKNAISNKCKKWKPYSSIASRYFYKALDLGLTKTEFHLYK